MEEVIEESGTIKMLYNYLSIDRKLFKINETFKYNKIIKTKGTCKCSGKINTFYVVDGFKIPTSRAVQI